MLEENESTRGMVCVAAMICPARMCQPMPPSPSNLTESGVHSRVASSATKIRSPTEGNNQRVARPLRSTDLVSTELVETSAIALNLIAQSREQQGSKAMNGKATRGKPTAALICPDGPVLALTPQPPLERAQEISAATRK